MFRPRLPHGPRIRPGIWMLVAMLVLTTAPARALAAGRAGAARKPAMAAEGNGPPIDITCAALVAPAAVHVKAMPKVEEALGAEGEAPAAGPAPAPRGPSPLDYRYDWDFGDPSGRWNRLPGWNAAHIYDTPGKYTITLTVTDTRTGKSVRSTTWVRVAPDERRRVYVSATGDDRQTGASPAGAVRSAQRAFQLAPNDAVILFRRGDVFDISNTIGIPSRNLRVGNYSESAPTARAAPAPAHAATARRGRGNAPAPIPDAVQPLPVLRRVGGNNVKAGNMFTVMNGARDVLFEGIEFDSQWGLDSEYGSKRVPARAFSVGGTNFAVRDSVFRNVNDGVNNELKPTGVLVQDNHFTKEIRAYCVWGVGQDLVVVGNVMTHSRVEHLIRCSEPGATRLLIAHNDMSRPNNTKGSIELRRAHWFYVANNYINGGTMRLGPQDNDQQISPRTWKQIKATWGVVQDNRFDNIFVNILLGTEHVAIRNNVVRVDGMNAFRVSCDKPGYHDVRKVLDVRIENNTAINMRPKGQFLYLNGRPIGLTVRNNVYIAPKLGEGNAPQAAAVYTTAPDLNGIEALENNVWPAGPNVKNYLNKAPASKQQWWKNPQVKGERYAAVPFDENDNVPQQVGAGAKMGTDRAERQAKRAREPRGSGN